MKLLTTAMILAALTPLALTPCAPGQDKPATPLDRALDESTDTAKPAPAKPAPPAEAATPPAAKAGANALDPDAADALETQDLTKKLTGKDTDAEGAEAMLKEILTRMGDSAQRLHATDPGPMTQETQRRITTNLDQLIEMMRETEQQPSSSPPKPGPPGQKRERTQGPPKPGPHEEGGNQAAVQSTLTNSPSKAPESNGIDIKEHTKEWGNLPDRERDLIVHGAKEESLPAYKDIIQQYYQALAEINKTTRDR